jgi:hypothetical protein
VCPKEHIPPPVCRQKPNNPRAATTLLRAPLYSTSPHSQRGAAIYQLVGETKVPGIPGILDRGGKWREIAAAQALAAAPGSAHIMPRPAALRPKSAG